MYIHLPSNADSNQVIVSEILEIRKGIPSVVDKNL
jgi:hypothetical protein